MMKVFGHKFFGIFLLALFLLTQFSASAHALEYGNGPHKHDDKACIIMLVSENELDDIAILPTLREIPASSDPIGFATLPAVSIAPAISIKACVRGPPHT